MAKKRKETGQSSTLDRFFNQNATPGSNKKAKLQATPAPAKCKATKPTFRVAPDEIIVIDSDDELQDTLVIDDSSDIEVLQDGPSNTSVSDTKSNRARSTQPEQDALHEDMHDVFGEPSLLTEGCPRRTGIPEDGIEDTDFGTPTLLNVGVNDVFVAAKDDAFDFTAVSNNQPIRPSPHPLQRTKSSGGTSHVEHDPMNAGSSEQVWELGDDEDADEDADAPVDEANIEENITDSTGDAVQTCPICNTLLDKAMSHVDIEAHVNACMDAIPPSPPRPQPNVNSNPAASTSKVFKALSSLQTFHTPPRDVKPVKVESKDDEGGPGAFSVLMNSHKENEAWKEATVAEDRNFRSTKANGGRRNAPFYKVMRGMPIAVDAFRYGSIPNVTAYFLTHAHSDHYTNLSGSWKSGPIYCSEGTANLIVHMLGVDRKWVHALPMDIATIIPNTGGVTVTLIEANHCPGSCLFLFEGTQTVNAGDSAYRSHFVGTQRVFRYLHCGDFRASPRHVMHSAVQGKKIDVVYLDTTYLDPKYCFPPQSEVITACAELARRLVLGESLLPDGPRNSRVSNWFSIQGKSKGKEVSKRTLVVVGTYSIGKERVVKAIAKALQTKVYSDPRKMAILRCEADPELDGLLTSDPLEAGVHLLPLGTIASDRLKLYLERWKGHFTGLIGFRPTGWTFTQAKGSDTIPSIPSVIAKSQSKSFTFANITPTKASTANLQLFGVPYSEHSSFFELTCFALSLDWVQMIATVNVGSEASRGKMAKWVQRWEAEKKKRGKTDIVQYRSPDYW